jgi:hypothetical protein
MSEDTAVLSGVMLIIVESRHLVRVSKIYQSNITLVMFMI